MHNIVMMLQKIQNTFIVLEKLGTKFLPTLFELKIVRDCYPKIFHASNLSDRL